MKTTSETTIPPIPPHRDARKPHAGFWPVLLCLLGGLAAPRAGAAVTIYTNSFEGYTNVATSWADTTNANPTGGEWNIVDDTALDPTTAGAGVQVINWLTNYSGAPNQCLLLRASSEADVYFTNAKSGTRYQLDFWAYISRGPTSDRGFYLILRGEGADFNGDDYLAYRTDRATNSTRLYYYDGVGPSAATWRFAGTNHLVDAWQHHRMVIDPNALTFSLYVDDMTTPVLTNANLSRCEVAVPTMIRIINEGNSADDGYFAIDDLSLTVDDAISLTNTFTEGFEDYPARTNTTDNANPQGPWITTEIDGTGSGRPRAPAKVQIVDSSVVPPHSGNNCLKLEGGQRAGTSLAWGQTPQSDVQITWWARVPAAVQSSPTADAVYLRMSLYGAEGGNTLAGDSALMGYGIRRQSGTNCGGPTSLTYYTTAWQDSGVQYTPDTWEEYQITTFNNRGTYSIVKSPSSASPVVLVDQAPFISTATTWGPTFMVAWSSSNGTNHPPVYLDDVEVKSLVSTPTPVTNPYTVQFNGTRFTNVTVLTLGGPIGAVAVDPRDQSTILFTTDAASDGGIYQATKVAPGNWLAEPTSAAVPIVSNLAYPSGLTIEPTAGTLWWTHDYVQSVMRLRSPWSANSPEEVIADFVCPTNDPAAGGVWLDDDPCDCTFAPTNFTGSLGQPNQLVVLDRGTDFNGNNTLFLVDPSTALLMQTNYDRYLYGPSVTALGTSTMVGMTTLAQSGEIVTLNQDGQVTAVNADGSGRLFWPDFYSDPSVSILPATLASDPVTGRLWIGDALWDQVWSCAPDGTASQQELSFPLTNPQTGSARQLQMHSPGGGMTFAPDGSFMVLSDNSTVNGGGRLLIFHNEPFAVPPFTITNVSRNGPQLQLAWSSAGAVKYGVQRGTNLADLASFQNLATNLTVRQFTDTNAAAASAFYRVVATPSVTP